MARQKAPCGTPTAYNRHRRNGEEPCEECRRAKSEEKAARDEKKRVEQAEQAREVFEGLIVGEVPTRVALLEEQRDLLRAHSQMAPPQSIAGISKQLSAILAEIDELTQESEQATEANGPSASHSSQGGGVDDIARRRAERERQRRNAV